MGALPRAHLGAVAGRDHDWIAPAVRGGRARTPSASGPVADPRRESRHRLVPGGASRTASPDAPA